MSFWLARGGVLGLSMSKSALMQSRDCLPRRRPLRQWRHEAAVPCGTPPRVSPQACMLGLVAHLCRLPPLARWGVRSAPRPGIVQFSGGEGLLRHRPPRLRCSPGRRRPPRSTHRRIVTPDAGVVRVAEPVVRGVKKPPEYHRVRHAGEVPLRVSMRGGRCQLAGGAVV
jgi:hypothetical protein